MTHFYNAIAGAIIKRPTAKALEAAISNKIFSFLTLGLFLLVNVKVMAQDSEIIYGNQNFNNLNGFYVQTVNGQIVSSSNQLRAYTATGSNAFNGYIAIKTKSFTLKKGYNYAVSFTARALDHNQGGVGNVTILRGNAADINWALVNNSLGSAEISKSTVMGSYTISFTATDNLTNQFIALKLSTDGGNQSELYLDNLVIRETCTPVSPQVTSNGSCSENVRITLTASGAVAGIEEYRWYTVATGGTAIANAIGSQYVTDPLPETQEFYASIYNIETDCESPRVPVIASVGGLLEPTVRLTKGSCDGVGNETKEYTASGGSEGSYRWYSVALDGAFTLLTSSNGQPITSSTLTRNTNSEKGDYAVRIIGEGCQSDPAYFNVDKGYPSAPNNNATGVVCGNQLTLKASGATLGQSYNWYATVDGVSTYIGQGATFVTTVTDLNTTYSVSKVNTASGCESTTRRTATITVTSELQYSAINGSATVCQGSTGVIYNVPSSVGATYSWRLTPNPGFSGATITSGTASNQITVSYPNASFVGEILVTVSNTCSSYTSSIAVQATNSNVATGRIIEPVNLELGKRAEFKFETNVPDDEIVALQWYQRVAPSNTWSQVQTINGRDIVFEQMPGNINGLMVDIQVKSTTAETYCITNLGLTGTYSSNSFPISNTTIVPLPVELISFKAQRNTRGVNLTWATASELDNKGFEIQVSTNSKDFTTIGFVESKVGTTSIRQDYSFLDTKAVSGTRYYRLKQIDFDGKFEYSAIRAVALDGGSSALAAYPNPFEDFVVVKLNGTEARKVNVLLTNSLGKKILEQQEETAGNTITVDMSNVTTKGMYILHVLDNGNKHAFKLMKR